MEVVDAGRKQLVRLARGVLISADALSLPMEAESAVRTADGWFIAGKDGTGAHVVYFLGADRAPQLVLRTPPDARTSLPQRAARLSESNGEVLLSLAYPPFSTFVINPAEGLRLRFSPADAVPIDEEKADRTIPFWIGLPAIGLDGGWFVQSLADVRSDRRLLFLYGADGAVVRQTEIEVPLGIAARLPEQPVLIVMRQLGLREIVFYRWRWR